MKKIHLPFGDSFLDVDIPDIYADRILTEKFVPGLKNEREAILSSLENPSGCEALRKLVSGNDKVVIVTTDNTRPCPDDRILPIILEVLTGIIPRDNITIIIGLGLHPPLSYEDLVYKLGKDIVDSYNVINHDPAQTVFVGETSRGVPVEVNYKIVEADFCISTGFIEPHFFAGFSGGRKSIAPGVSGVRSIRSNHSYRMLDHPCARAGILENNPIHEDMCEQAKIVGLDFIVNVLLNANGEITHIFSGEPVIAHETGCRVSREITQVTLDRMVDITLTTNGGAPLDLDLYQTCKGIDTAAQITREGGIIIIASSCDQGTGPEDFRALHASVKSPGDVLKALSHSSTCAEGVSWQNQLLARAQLNHQIFLFSNLDDNATRSMMITPIHSIQEGLEKALKMLGNDSRLAVIPQGPLILPKVKKSELTT